MSFIISPSTITDPANAPVDLQANQSLYYNTKPSTFTITNWDSFTTYTVATTNGTVSQANGTVTYTPSATGAGGFTINGRSISLTVLPGPLAEFLLIGGAGGTTANGSASNEAGAGGGSSAGGYIYSSGTYFQFGTSYSVAIGAGSPGQGDGNVSTFSTYTAQKGKQAGGAGGAQGGGGFNTAGAGGSGTSLAGFVFCPAAGSNFTGGCAASYEGGGGAGNGGRGGDGSSVPGGTGSGEGGIGFQTTIRGTTEYFGGGGAGGSQTAVRPGGLGGGGNGGYSAAGGAIGSPGTANTGGGAGGAISHSNANVSIAGGSGILIIAYADTLIDLTISAGLTYTRSTVSRPGYKVYTITGGTGTIQW